MILLGNESKDSATSQVGPMLAEDLGIEQITNVMELHDRQAVRIMDGKKGHGIHPLSRRTLSSTVFINASSERLGSLVPRIRPQGSFSHSPQE